MREIAPIDLPENTEAGSMVRLIADRLELGTLPAARDGEAANDDLLMRMFAYVADAERRLAEQDRRIAYLQDLSMTDELTGLLNRRGFSDQVRRMLASAKRYGHQGLLLYCDVDDFKSINDAHGHAAGDAALQHIARLLEGSVRATDLVARLGGDEFAVALVQTSWRDGAKRARTLKWMIERRAFVWGKHRIALGMSVGEQPFGPEDRVADLICRADMAMYYCKRSKAEAVSFQAAE